MGISFGHLVVILIIVLLLFGAGRMPQIMADIAKGLKSFKNNLKDDEVEIKKPKKKKK